jgi:hypothetical protein
MKEKAPPGAVVWLDSDSLFSKWGFRDGDTLRENDAGIPAKVDSHAVLCHLVRAHLLPALPREVRVYEICSMHNPIRADDEVNDIPYTGVWVTDEMIRAAVQHVVAQQTNQGTGT